MEIYIKANHICTGACSDLVLSDVLYGTLDFFLWIWIRIRFDPVELQLDREFFSFADLVGLDFGTKYFDGIG